MVKNVVISTSRLIYIYIENVLKHELFYLLLNTLYNITESELVNYNESIGTVFGVQLYNT